MRSTRRVTGFLSFAVLALFMGRASPAGAQCGPGPHWVDSCLPGFNAFRATGAVTVLIDGNVLSDNTLSGFAFVFRGHGNPFTSPHQIDTELTSLDLHGLSGAHVHAGDGIANLACDDPLLCSRGFIQELPDPRFASSFFDVFFELELPGLGTFHSGQLPAGGSDGLPMLFPSIDRVPPDPGTTGRGQNQVGLYDANGTFRGGVLESSLVIGAAIPEPSTVALLAGGLTVLVAARRRRHA